MFDSRSPRAGVGDLVTVSTAILVGVGTGLGAVAFVWLLARIGEARQLLEEILGPGPGLLVAMGGAGLLVGWIVARWASEAKGHGVPEVMEAVAMRGGRIRPRVALAKVLASSLTIGAGGSAGREGPIVQVGSALGSTVGQALGFSNERVRTLVACGAAAGIAATFNAPIAGAIFALEVILGTFGVQYFGAVVLSGVAAGIVSRTFLSSSPAFVVPAYPLNHLAEIPIHATLGVAAALVAVVFVQALYAVEGLFDRWSLPLPLKTGLGMLATAALAITVAGREVLGSGLDFLGEAIAGNVEEFPIRILLGLLLAKIAATCLTLGSGNSGGVFAPSLFVGAVLGGMVGHVAHGLWPEIAVDPGAYAIVGMAAVFAGAARAPMTAILIVFEMSNDYRLILPLMLATVLSTLLAERLFEPSIYTLKLRLKGIHLEQGRDVDVMDGVAVEEIMSRDLPMVDESATLPELSDFFGRTRAPGALIASEKGELRGLVTVTDLDRAVEDGLPRRTRVLEIAQPRDELVVAHPDESLGEALRRMGVRGHTLLPVVTRRRPEEVVGWVRQEDVLRAYQMARARRAELQHRTERARLRNLDGTRFLDFRLGPEDAAVGRTVTEIGPGLPEGAILVSIRRDGRVLIPHGTTRFRAGDQVTAFVRADDVQALRDVFGGGGAPSEREGGAGPE